MFSVWWFGLSRYISGCPSSCVPFDQTFTVPAPASWPVMMLIAPPSDPATQPVLSATPSL